MSELAINPAEENPARSPLPARACIKAAPRVAASRPAAGLAPDPGELFSALSNPLRQVVTRELPVASGAVVEDACQFAWDSLVAHAAHVRREAAFAWLTRTAKREASRISRRDARDVSLEALLESGGDGALNGSGAGEAVQPHELVERRERLSLIARLPERQRRLIWMQGLGLSYDEIASRTGESLRTIDRQLSRARRTMRRADR